MLKYAVGVLWFYWERALLRILQEQRTYGFNIFLSKMQYFFNAKFLWFLVPPFLAISMCTISLRNEE